MRYHFHFMARRRVFMILSGIALVITIFSLALQGMNYGVDFTGGLLMDLKFDKPVAVSAVLGQFAAHGIGDAEVQGVGQPSPAGSRSYLEFNVRTKPVPDTTRQAVYADLKSKVGNFQEISLSEVQPAIGSQLRRGAFLAVGLATIGMILYLALRFELKFATAAVVALLHDILLTIGLFSVFHLPVTESFIAAVLTVYGYSMNDTIIVFDRIRERLKLRKRGETLSDVIDLSINQVLSRTINTVITVVLALLAVTIFGGATIRDLVVALLVGVSFGTYSSIFIASPVYLWMAERGRPSGADTMRPAKAE